MTSELLRLLRETPVSEIAPKTNEFIIIPLDATVNTALQTLIKNQIFSAPVQNQKQKFVGILSALDIMSFIIDLFNEEDEELKGKTIFDIISTKNSKYHSAYVYQVLDHFAETSEPYHSISPQDSILDAIEIFSKGLHRLVIADTNKDPIGFLTQSAVIHFLANHLGPLGNKTIGELKVGTRSCITVTKDTKTIEAFSILRQRQISGVGVVDSRGALIGNISSRDLNALSSDNLYNVMFLPVSTFISAIKNLLVNEDQPIISVSEESKLGYVVSRMSCNRIHRIYIADSHQKPLGVIAMRDIIRCVLQEVKKE